MLSFLIFLSQRVRRTEYTFITMGTNTSYMLANGTAWREQTFVRIQWAWFAAPGTLVLLSVIFCVITIVRSGVQANRYMVWKSSSLSIMLALSEELHRRIGGLRSLSENESALEYTRASLKRNSDGEWSLQDSPMDSSIVS
jgi:hypothetical protein